MKIQDKIYINLDEEKIEEKILEHLTYRNPDYYQKMNLGYSVRNIPKVLKTYTITERTLSIWRGEALHIKQFISHCKYDFDHPSIPEKLQYINKDLNLDEYQEGAVKAMKNTRQGVVHAVTSAGKSLIIIKGIVELGQRALIVVHLKTLQQQLLEDIDKYIRDEKGNKIKVGIIGGGKFELGPITIGIDKSIIKHLDEVKLAFGTVVLDECHLCPAHTISTIVNSINARYRYGFTGTLKRKDQKEFLIFSVFGSVIYKITKEELLQKNRVVPVLPNIIESDTRFDWDGVVEGLIEREEKNPTAKARALRDKVIMLDDRRNHLILDHVSRLKGKIIILSRFVEPCYTLQNRLREEFGLESGVITGRNDKEALESYKQMKHKDLKIIFATIGCVATGVSISDLEHLVLISPVYSNELLLHQIRGRLMRTSKGKEFGTFHFIYDQHIFTRTQLKKFLKIINN